MLQAESRLRRPAEFTAVLRRGARASGPLLSVHLLPPAAQVFSGDGSPAAKAGLVVSKAVGGSVVRHRTSRRLRHLLRPRLAVLPAGTRVVVRAAPGAASASSSELGQGLDAALSRLATRSAGATRSGAGAQSGRSVPAGPRPASERRGRSAGGGRT